MLRAAKERRGEIDILVEPRGEYAWSKMFFDSQYFFNSC